MRHKVLLRFVAGPDPSCYKAARFQWFDARDSGLRDSGLIEPKIIIGDWLFMNAIRRHGGRVGWRVAGRYTKFHKRAQSVWRPSASLPPIIASAVADFGRNRITSFHDETTARVAAAMSARLTEREAQGEDIWAPAHVDDSNRRYRGQLLADFPEIRDLFDGPLGAFLEGCFRSYDKIFYGTMYRSDNVSAGPRNSALWHSDSGPGTCINVMFYLDEVGRDDGALEAVPWDVALAIFAKERAEMRTRMSPDRINGLSHLERRAILCDWYRELIENEYAAEIRQPTGPAGLVVPFANNTIHRGGFPRPGHSRRAIVFHCYPSERPIDWSAVKARGLEKTQGYPLDPGADF